MGANQDDTSLIAEIVSITKPKVTVFSEVGGNESELVSDFVSENQDSYKLVDVESDADIVIGYENTDDAMELVQETMLQLVKRYSDRPDNELKLAI